MRMYREDKIQVVKEPEKAGRVTKGTVICVKYGNK